MTAAGNNLALSMSAVAEYLVFVSLVAINTYGMSAMTYIANWYYVVEEETGPGAPTVSWMPFAPPPGPHLLPVRGGGA